MQHLKLYEEYSEYTKLADLSTDEGRDLFYKHKKTIVSMNKKYIDRLSNLLKGKNIEIYTHGIKDKDGSMRVCNYLYFPFKYKSRGDGSRYTSNDCRIYELHDEYFLIEVNNDGYHDNYLCDQFDSLLKLLEDLDITFVWR
jgi:hypothetical protein